MAFDKGNLKATPADAYISGKSAHQLLAAIAAGTLPADVTPQSVAQADVERTARKLAARPA
jgi:hypothetical protein